SGLAVETISNGGTPDLYSAHEVTVATEHRPGTYIYSDRSLVEIHGFGDWADCALRVKPRVVSHSAPDRCVIDAGSKTLSSDMLGAKGQGRNRDALDWEVCGVNEDPRRVRGPPGSGEAKDRQLVTVIPNPACVVTNLFDRVYAARQGRVETFYE